MITKRKPFVISLSYMHPICSISLSHARIFLLADILGRYKRKENYEVYMPIGLHFSGKEILGVCQEIKKGIEDSKISDKNKTYQLFTNYYRIKKEVLKEFRSPISILDYFSKQHIQNLKELKTMFDFDKAYKTNDLEYERFVQEMFKFYEKKGIIKKTKIGKVINFNKKEWKEKSISQLNSTNVVGRGGNKMLMESIKRLNNTWTYERERGIGIEVDKKIISPMFDSQLYTLFESRKLNYKLPVDVFFGEYHLSTWIATKICIESTILPKKERTKSYFLLGMALSKNRKRMSSSRGTSVLLPDLLQEYGPLITRISILLIGHPNKDFMWDEKILDTTKKVINEFDSFKSEVANFSSNKNRKIILLIKESKLNIKREIEKGNYRLACIEALILFPKKIKKFKKREGKKEIEEYINYIDYIFLPK